MHFLVALFFTFGVVQIDSMSGHDNNIKKDEIVGFIEQSDIKNEYNVNE